MADDLSWIDHPANLRANAVLLRAVADQSLLHANEIERLRKVRDAARALTEECRDGHPPSLGVLARLEDALYVEWADAAALTEGKRT